MQIRLFVSSTGSLKKDGHLNDLHTLKEQQALAFVLVHTEADLVNVLNQGWLPVNKDVLHMLKQHYVFAPSYTIQTLAFLHFYQEETIHVSLKVVITDNLFVLYNKSNNTSIKALFDRIFKENHFWSQSTAHFYTIFLQKMFDAYLHVLDAWHDDIASTEILILEQEVHDMSKQLAEVRKKIVYLRTVIQDSIDQLELIVEEDDSLLYKGAGKNIEKALKKAYTVQEEVERMNILIMNVYNLYLTHLSTRQNEISKMLTLVATIFMPVTFITGFFGMNFHMPFLSHEYGYIICLVAMLATIIGTIFYFKKRGWI